MEELKFLGIKLVDNKDFANIMLRFLFNGLVIFIITGLLYYRRGGRKDYLFTNIMISTVVFVLCFLLENVKIRMGFALGLFAVFGIIRYRTEQIPIKEMTYLFIAIGISIVNALANKKVSYAELLFANAALVGVTSFMEYVFMGRGEQSRKVIYENIENIKPENYKTLVEDLRSRTGLDVVRAEVGNINFLKDTAEVTFFYHGRRGKKDEN